MRTHKPSVDKMSDSQAKIKESANDLLTEGKRLAGEIYHQSIDAMGGKVEEVEEYVHEYSDKIVKKIRTNPFASVLIAAGVGMLISTILRK